MRVIINSDVGIDTKRLGNAVEIEGRDHHEAPFDLRWDDQYAEIHEGGGAAALTYEAYRDTGFFIRFFRYDQNDQIFMTYQMSHQWDPTTSVYPHMHYIPMSSGSGQLYFDYAYAWTVPGTVLPSGVSWVSGSFSSSLTPADQYLHKVLRLSEVQPPSGSKESSVLVVKIARNPTLDSYETLKDHGLGQANVGILFFDTHYQKLKAGTIAQFPM